MKEITICYAPDNNYAIPCSISIQSVMNTVSNDVSVKFLILDGGLTNNNKNLINQIVNLHANSTVEFVCVDDKEYKQYYTEAWGTAATYRFKIDSILSKWEKVLYLDCDIIANKSVEELWETNIGENIVALVPDVWYKKQLKRFPEKQQPYFNTGVCLFNLKKFREQGISDKLIEYFNKNQDKIIYPDQDPYNVVLDGRIYQLNYKYNWCWHWDKNEYFEEFGEIKMDDAVIIHYIFNKPWWSTNIHIASNKYFETINTIPKNIRKTYKKYRTNVVINKYSLYLFGFIQIFSMVNYYSKIIFSLCKIPLLKIKNLNFRSKYYLFGFIYILKISKFIQKNNDIKLVKRIGKY